MRTVKLYGVLGRRFGREHRLDVASAAEAVRAMCANFREFAKALRDHPHGFHVLAGRTDVADPKLLDQPAGRDEAIKIVPATAGSKKAGLLQTIVGAVLIAADVLFFHTGTLTQVGLALALGGVAQLLTPTPKAPTSSNSANTQSYVFTGAANTSEQGAPVPIGYGRMFVGSQVASQGITISEIPV